ncbi:hypothetical protein HGM15179_017874 [Zosterops borbonicus]|uniref:Integrase catalytic domain-containing protein n=1 Tax=Zosterops borbonicus TaxID=364589 RepID=A0A8K1G063_9PASS|nr:hypothetical protein HGM15179_017874 [Zosterops borbonicus]
MAVATSMKSGKCTKTDRDVDDDVGEGPSIPPDIKSEVKATDTRSEATIESFSMKDLHGLRKDYIQRPDESIISCMKSGKCTKTDRDVDDDVGEGPSIPPDIKSEVKATDTRSEATIESFSMKDLHGLRKDYIQRPDESIISWEAWQIDYITLPQTRQGKRHVLTVVEATTGWLETYPVSHATARNTILGLEKQVLWRHGTPERIESDNGTHLKINPFKTWAKEHGIEWVYHIPYHAPAADFGPAPDPT